MPPERPRAYRQSSNLITGLLPEDTELELIRSNSSLPVSRFRSASTSRPITFDGGIPLNQTTKSRLSIQPSLQQSEESVNYNEIDGDLSAETKAKYDQFSKSKKRLIVFTVAYTALLAPFSSSSFLPSIPEIVLDLNSSEVAVNASVAIFIVVLAVFPLLWSVYAGIAGRRPIYLISLPIFSLGSLGVALCTDFTSLVITRIIQGIGSSAVLAVGAGSIGDIYPRSQRGTALGFFYLLVLVGPATAPFIDGILTEYVSYQGWRAMQWLLTAMGVFGTALVYFTLPETIHHRTIDDIRAERRKLREESSVGSVQPAMSRLQKLREEYLVFINPILPLKFLLEPHVLTISLNSSFILMSTYTILVPLALTLAPRYEIKNIAVIGLLYLPSGLGNLAAAQVTGRFSDWVLRYRFKRNGRYVAEDRLYASLFGAGFLQPIAVLGLGWLLQKGTGVGGLIGSCILLFLSGVGLMSVLTPTNTYLVDVKQNSSAEVIAVNNFLRYLFSAAASGFVLPLINKVGVGWTNTLSAALCWLGFLLILLTIKFGERMRNFSKRFEAEGDEGSTLGSEKEIDK